MTQISYASAIGSIMYAMICTRPDLSYALSMTSRYQANPGEGHWTTVKNILKYLRRTKDKSSKQDTIADSTTKAEYVAVSEATKETVWIKEFISELRVIISIADAAIAQAKEPRSQHRPKQTFKCFYLI
ncbi:hypothetical protein V6N11_051122 [Hibiscus sabdariffa]|uniref:Gag/pol protein n=1 Tax=Hibiscus sabdariffa TaxID=183260 RepID=A0ABR2R2W6_9ROSI